MKIRSLTMLLSLSGCLIGTQLVQAQNTLALFNFTNAPTSVGTDPENTTAQADFIAPGLGLASFTVVRQNTGAESLSGIANVTGSSDVGVAQISGLQMNTFAWEVGSTNNFFEFTVNFGGVPANEISFTELILTGRTGVEWTNTGGINNYAANRRSALTVRSSLDNFATNIGAEINPAFGNSDNNWATTTIDLTGLLVTGTEITFRIYARSDTPELSGNSIFNRTQLNSVELIGTIPEPSTYAAIFGLLALGFVAWRRR